MVVASTSLAASHFTHCLYILMVAVCCLINYSHQILSLSVTRHIQSGVSQELSRQPNNAAVDQWAWTPCHIDVYTLQKISFSRASS